MRVIVIGCGRVGAGLATALDLDGHDVSVVDSDSSAFQRLGPGFHGQVLGGVGFDRETLEAAGIERCDALAAVTGSDEVNAVASRLAKQRFRVPRVVARMYDPRTAELYRRLGVLTISPVAWGIARLAELLTLHDIGTVTSLGSGNVDLIEAVVPESLDGSTIRELEVPGEVRVAAITRSGRTFVPDAAARLRAADVVSLAVSAGSAGRVETLLGAR